jgi:hypothetical protein
MFCKHEHAATPLAEIKHLLFGPHGFGWQGLSGSCGGKFCFISLQIKYAFPL